VMAGPCSVESQNQIAALKQNERAMRMQEERLRKVEKVAAAGQLAASLAHEINNPLAAVTNALYILQNISDLPADTAELINTAASELARVSGSSSRASLTIAWARSRKRSI